MLFVQSAIPYTTSKIAILLSAHATNLRSVVTLFALFEYLPERDYRCWAHFVNACCLLCTTLINIRDVGTAHDHLLHFCKEFEKNYEKTV